MAACVGAAVGATPFLDGLYDFAIWAPIGMAITVIAMGLLAAGETRPSRRTLAGTGALTVLGLVQLASVLWAESVDAALREGLRTIVYATCLGLLTVVATRSRERGALLVGLGVGVGIVAVVLVVKLLGGDDLASMFLRGRLDEPVGYVNGQAAAMLLGFWPAFALAETARRPLVAGAGVAAAVGFLALALFSQSRGSFAGILFGLIVVAAVVPRRGRRGALTAVVAVAVAVLWVPLGRVLAGSDPTTGLPQADDVRRALLIAGAVALGAAAVWAGLTAAKVRTAAAERWRSGSVRATAAVVLAVVAAAGIAAAAPRFIDATADFRELKPVDDQSRLSSGGGNRFDYWRVAWQQFESRPLLGIGAGNYDTTYFRDRRTTEDVRQAHSFPLQTLGDTGLLGASALVALLAALAAAFARARPAALATPADRGVLVAGAGIVATWGGHASVDWLHLLPGVTIGALLAFACVVGVAAWPQHGPATTGFRWRPLAFAAATLAVTGLGVLLEADSRRDEARTLVVEDPARAVGRAQDALRLNRHDLTTYYVLAAAEARLDRYEDARGTLREAARREPHDFIPHALLGDLAARAGDWQRARIDYARAVTLNPRDRPLRAALTDAERRAAAD